MSQAITVYQKPTCSKCRELLKLLAARELPFETINYYETPFTVQTLKALLQKLGAGPRDILRKDEPLCRELGLAKKPLADEELLQLLVQHPDLIQRPILVRGDKAVLARPLEKAEPLL